MPGELFLGVAKTTEVVACQTIIACKPAPTQYAAIRRERACP